MPAGEMREIRRRIGSVQSTMKITRAMELIAASRIMKAERALAAARPYAVGMAHVLQDLVKAVGTSISHPLLDVRETQNKNMALVICSDRGLAGPFNVNVLKLAQQTLAGMPGKESSVAAVGRKASSYFKFRGVPIDKVWVGISDRPTYADAKEVGNYVIEAYQSGAVDSVSLVYTVFTSVFTQTAQTVQLLPIDPTELAKLEHSAGQFTAASIDDPGGPNGSGPEPDTIFDPDPESILDTLLPKSLQSLIFSAMLESAASEHASRRKAMKAATDNARDLTRVLTLQANKARQAAITTEILEVVGGAEGLKKKS